jgi:hypothetical protein
VVLWHWKHTLPRVDFSTNRYVQSMLNDFFCMVILLRKPFNVSDTSEFHFFAIKFQHPKISNYNNSYLIIHVRYAVVHPLFLTNFTRNFWLSFKMVLKFGHNQPSTPVYFIHLTFVTTVTFQHNIISNYDNRLGVRSFWWTVTNSASLGFPTRSKFEQRKFRLVKILILTAPHKSF